tara:strand:- start:320 stop:556 length:237 start_codon:yes stop_codon:yes gene_type:complete
MMGLNKEQRRERRRRIIRKAVQLAKEVHAEDEDARRDFLINIINQSIDIPGLSERTESKLFHAIADLLVDAFGGDENG